VSVVRTALRETLLSLRTIWDNRSLRRLNLALAGSIVGDWAYATAIVVWAYENGGPTAVGLWFAIRLAAMAVVTPFAATLADRFPRIAVMVGTDLLRLVIVLAVAAVIAMDGPAAVVYVLATLASLVSAPFRPAQMALLPGLVRSPEELTAANAVGSTVESLAMFVGPAIGGLLLIYTTIPVVLLVNAVTFVWSALLVLSIARSDAKAAPASAVDPPDPAGPATDTEGPADPEDDAAESFWTQSVAGIKTLLAHPDLRLVTLLYCAQTVVAGASIVFEVTMADELLGTGAAGVGYLDSVLGVGALVGGLVAVALAPRHRLATDFGVAVLFWAVPLLLVTVWPAAGVAFLALFIIGVANPVADVNASTILQRLVPDAVMGRVFGALDAALIAAMALGSLVMPLLVQQLGLRWALAVLTAPVVLLWLATVPRLRSLDERLEPPAHLPLVQAQPVFQPLLQADQEAVALQLVEQRVDAGTTVLTQGEAGDRFYLLESGGVDIVRDGTVVNHLVTGDCFGEIALLRDVPRTASVVATEDSVLQTLSREGFLAAVSNPEARTAADAIAARRLPAY
jgi:MFS family permease